MSDIRYVVLSDVHFGATNSVLTSIRADSAALGGFSADPETPSPLIAPVLAAIRTVTAGQEVPPALILAGDVLDLALSPDEVAATAFEGFVDAAFGSTAGPVFSPTVYYLSGNHDHHLWEANREAAYVKRLLQLQPSDPIPPPSHTTRITPAELLPAETDLLSALIHRRPGCANIEVRVAYPNLALSNDDGSAIQVVSHGHYSESIYTLMSRLRLLLFPEQTDPKEMTDIETLEAENFAWIDFFWSTLGRSGDVGIDVSRIYSDLQSPANLDVLATNLAVGLVSRPSTKKGMPWLRSVESKALAAIMRREVRHTARAERGTPDVVLSANGKVGLRTYLEGAVAGQITSEIGAIPARAGFVFGHTHKPFYDMWTLAGWPGTTPIANTGGWVVDTAQAAPCQGGAAVLIDDDLNSAVLVMYQQPAQPGGPLLAPRVLTDPEQPPGPDSLAARITDRINADGPTWQAITATAGPLVEQRWELQAALCAGTENLRGSRH